MQSNLRTCFTNIATFGRLKRNDYCFVIAYSIVFSELVSFWRIMKRKSVQTAGFVVAIVAG